MITAGAELVEKADNNDNDDDDGDDGENGNDNDNDAEWDTMIRMNTEAQPR